MVPRFLLDELLKKTRRISNGSILLPMGATKPAPSDQRVQEFRALVDTGSEHSLITLDVIQALDLKPIGPCTLRGYGGQKVPSETYRVSVCVRNDMIRTVVPKSRDFSKIVTIEEAARDPFNLGFDILLGMDFLQKCALLGLGSVLVDQSVRILLR